jgi:hypothetical protein
MGDTYRREYGGNANRIFGGELETFIAELKAAMAS